MKKYKLVIFSMILVMFFVTGCEEEGTAPDPYSNGLLITLSQRKYDARNDVHCSKDLSNIIKFSAKNSEGELWDIEFQWGSNAQNGDTVFISDSYYNTIRLTSTAVGNYTISSSDAKANETYIKVLEFIDGEKIEAEIEGFIYEIGGGSTADSLKNGYFITTKFD